MCRELFTGPSNLATALSLCVSLSFSSDRTPTYSLYADPSRRWAMIPIADYSPPFDAHPHRCIYSGRFCLVSLSSTRDLRPRTPQALVSTTTHARTRTYTRTLCVLCTHKRAVGPARANRRVDAPPSRKRGTAERGAPVVHHLPPTLRHGDVHTDTRARCNKVLPAHETTVESTDATRTRGESVYSACIYIYVYECALARKREMRATAQPAH